MVDIGDEDRHPLGRDAAGKTAPDGNPDPLFHLLLEALGRAGHELVVLLVVEQDRHRVHAQRLSHSHEKLVQELLQPQLG